MFVCVLECPYVFPSPKHAPYWHFPIVGETKHAAGFEGKSRGNKGG